LFNFLEKSNKSGLENNRNSLSPYLLNKQLSNSTKMNDDMEKVRDILRKSMMDLVREVRLRDDVQVKIKKEDPTPILSFDQYKSTFLPQIKPSSSSSSTSETVSASKETLNEPTASSSNGDNELGHVEGPIIVESPRFTYDYGFNPLLYLADCIERNSKI
jgi:hypothetical protein